LLAAYEMTLRALDLVDRNDPLTQVIAKKVLEIGETGLKDPAEISKLAVQRQGYYMRKLTDFKKR
jgi:hypothetical protein